MDNGLEKKALGLGALAALLSGAGTLAGGVHGASKAPKGYGPEGFGRGAYQGAGTMTGAGVGGILGGGTGIAAGGLLGSLLGEDAGNIGAGLGGLVGGVGGAVGGGYLGHRMAKGVTGKPGWDEDKEDEEEDDDSKKAASCGCGSAPRYSKLKKMTKKAAALRYRTYDHMANIALAYGDQQMAKAASYVLCGANLVDALANAYPRTTQLRIKTSAVKIASAAANKSLSNKVEREKHKSDQRRGMTFKLKPQHIPGTKLGMAMPLGSTANSAPVRTSPSASGTVSAGGGANMNTAFSGLGGGAGGGGGGAGGGGMGGGGGMKTSQAQDMFSKLSFDAKVRIMGNASISPIIKMAFSKTLGPLEKRAFPGA